MFSCRWDEFEYEDKYTGDLLHSPLHSSDGVGLPPALRRRWQQQNRKTINILFVQTLFCRRKSKLFVEAGIVLAIYPVGSISSVVDCCLLRSKMHKSCLIWTSFKSNSINSDWRLSNNILKTKSNDCLLGSRNHVISGLFKLLGFILFSVPRAT